MKPSKFNYFFQVDDQAILGYNSLTTALVRLSSEEFGQIQEFCTDPRDDFFETRALGPFQEQLQKVGLLIPDDLDEVEWIRGIRSAAKAQDRRVGLIILPTLNCNFRCTYCFSYLQRLRMSAEVQQALLRFVEEKLAEATSLSVTWFGGEPTLGVDIIEALSAKLAGLCQQYEVPQQPGSIVTNGYLLSERMARRLKQAGISSAQITLDGDREVHNQRRPLLGGHGTFDRILDNVSHICDLLDIQIRINVDRSNADAALGALDALAACSLQGKVSVYFGHVRPFTEVCADVAGVCLSDQEFSELELALTKEALSRGFTYFPYPHLQLDGVCGADKRFGYVIAPDGLLFKCWAEASLGSAWSVGSLLTGECTPQQKENLGQYLAWDPLAGGPCPECRLLPICMGGCPYLRLRQGVEAGCNTWRYKLLQTLAIRYKLGDRLQLRRNHTERDSAAGQVPGGPMPQGDRAVLSQS